MTLYEDATKANASQRSQAFCLININIKNDL